MSEWLGANATSIAKNAEFGIMGIINATPDSFYDGGCFCAPSLAVEHAEILLRDGADILDIGAESTRPGATPMESGEEWRRLEPVLSAIREKCPNACVSVDTRHAEVAAKAISLGASVINDISACGHDAELMDVLAEYKPAYVLMHSKGDPANMQKAPHYGNVVAEIKSFFERGLHKLTTAGLPENHIAIDPGIGFGKNLEHNLAIIRSLGEFLVFGRPLLVGISMKSFFGKLLGLSLGERGEVTSVASALLFQQGATWHRVHDVRSARLALKLAAAIRL